CVEEVGHGSCLVRHRPHAHDERVLRAPRALAGEGDLVTTSRLVLDHDVALEAYGHGLDLADPAGRAEGRDQLRALQLIRQLHEGGDPLGHGAVGPQLDHLAEAARGSRHGFPTPEERLGGVDGLPATGESDRAREDDRGDEHGAAGGYAGGSDDGGDVPHGDLYDTPLAPRGHRLCSLGPFAPASPALPALPSPASVSAPRPWGCNATSPLLSRFSIARRRAASASSTPPTSIRWAAPPRRWAAPRRSWGAGCAAAAATSCSPPSARGGRGPAPGIAAPRASTSSTPSTTRCAGAARITWISTRSIIPTRPPRWTRRCAPSTTWCARARRATSAARITMPTRWRGPSGAARRSALLASTPFSPATICSSVKSSARSCPC